MEDQLMKLCEELTLEIQKAYEESVTVEDAEKLAAKFLFAQISIVKNLRDADLDFRMKKSGVKAVKAAIYMDTATKGEKKPTEAFIQATIDLSDMVQGEQTSLDKAEVQKDTLNNYLNVFKEAHIFFRGVAKGSFGG